MGKKTEQGPWTFLSIALIVAAVLYLIVYKHINVKTDWVEFEHTQSANPIEDESIDPKNKTQAEVFSSEEVEFFTGDWDLTYTILECNNVKESENPAMRVAMTYNVRFEKKTTSMFLGTGPLRTYFVDGVSREKHGTITVTVTKRSGNLIFETKRINEKTGEDVFEFENIDFSDTRLEGTYSNNSCSGDVSLIKND